MTTNLSTIIIEDNAYDLSPGTPHREGYDGAKRGATWRCNPHCEEHCEASYYDWSDGHTLWFCDVARPIIEAALKDQQ